MEKDKILVVEDELAIRKLIQFNLTRSNFDVIETAYGKQVPALIDAHHPALVVLDLGLPDIDGLELCAQIAETSPDTPIIIVSARDQDMEKIMGLELGADDYIVKPFNPLELVARIQSTLRRLRTMNPKQNAAAIHIGLFTVDLKTKRLSKSGKFIKLTNREFQLIELFAVRLNEPISRDELLDKIWGVDYFGDPKTVDVHIRRLREKIEDDPSNPLYLKTVWGTGYCFFDNGDGE